MQIFWQIAAVFKQLISLIGYFCQCAYEEPLKWDSNEKHATKI